MIFENKDTKNLHNSSCIKTKIDKLLAHKSLTDNPLPFYILKPRYEAGKDEFQKYLHNAGVILYEVKNIQYGKKLRIKVGSRLGEINLFYGKHDFSVARSPRTGTSAEINELISALIEDFLVSLI